MLNREAARHVIARGVTNRFFIFYDLAILGSTKADSAPEVCLVKFGSPQVCAGEVGIQ